MAFPKQGHKDSHPKRESVYVRLRAKPRCQAYVELKDLLAQPAEIAILLPDAGERLLTGLVTPAS